jgi:hypothetical protein
MGSPGTWERPLPFSQAENVKRVAPVKGDQRRSAKEAEEAYEPVVLMRTGNCGLLGWALEADISGYFDAIVRRELVEMIERRVKDGSVLRLIGKWINVGVVDEGRLLRSETGVGQGQVMTPLTQRKLLIQGQNMAHGDFICLGIHNHFLNQQADDLSSFFKIQLGQIRFHPLRKIGELLDQL